MLRLSSRVSGHRWLAALAGVALLAWAVSAAPAAIEKPDRNKVYKLSSRHGPWMIMVTSLSGETPDQESRAERAANELVYQLRRKGVPAYVYRQNDQYGEVQGVDRMGRGTKRKYVAQHGMIGVVAGNYPSFEDKAAQQTLKFIKHYEPKLKLEEKGKPTAELSMSLSKAFLARNPLLGGDDSASQVRDPLLLKINSGIEHSLLNNKGKYTLVVSSFYGNSKVKSNEFSSFDQKQRTNSNISLENAALESWQLCNTMRAQGHDAWVYHERFRSIVTVGSFQSEDDPEIARLKNMYGPKYKPRNEKSGEMVLVAESVQIPGRAQGDAPVRAWTMDPEPTLIKVPQR